MGNTIKNRRRQAQIREYAEPRGLYTQCTWDRRYIRKEILSGKLAPCFPGQEAGATPDSIIVSEREHTKSGFGDLEECPICLLFYPGGLNRMLCCKQSMCTECYLQVKQPPQPILTMSRCPFCKSDKFDHVYTGPLSAEQKRAQEVEQQKVLELQIRMQSEQRKADLERQQRPQQQRDEKEQPLRTLSTSLSLSSSPTSPEDDNNETNESEQDGHEGHGLGSSGGVEGGGGGGGDYDMNELEQLMFEEALRLSLLESKGLGGGGGGGGGVDSNPASQQAHPSDSWPVDEKVHFASEGVDHGAPAASSEEDDDAPEEEGEEDLNNAILLSLELSGSSSASSSSIAASLP